MKQKKVIGLILSLVLVLCVAVPGTLASDLNTEPTTATEPVTTATEAPTETPTEPVTPSETPVVPSEPETPSEPVVPSEPVTPSEPEEVFVHLDGCTEECTDEECACLCHVFQKLMECQNYDEFMSLLNGISNEDYAKFTKKQVEQIEQKLLELKPACTCIANEDGTLTYTEGCPVHEAPQEPVCTCIANEDGTLTYTEGCPVHKAPAAESGHIEGCSDECTNEECTCLCHVFKRLMECEDFEEFLILLESIPEEDYMKFTEEQLEQLNQKYVELEPEPVPPIELEETTDEPVVSEIIYPSVNYDWVAPFRAPVEG